MPSPAGSLTPRASKRSGDPKGSAAPFLFCSTCRSGISLFGLPRRRFPGCTHLLLFTSRPPATFRVAPTCFFSASRLPATFRDRARQQRKATKLSIQVIFVAPSRTLPAEEQRDSRNRWFCCSPAVFHWPKGNGICKISDFVAPRLYVACRKATGLAS